MRNLSNLHHHSTKHAASPRGGLPDPMQVLLHVNLENATVDKAYTSALKL